LLIRLNKEQTLTFVLVTHDRTVGARCERIVRMRDGQIISDDPTHPVTDSLTLAA
jgi:putative ABC transport system ATP-binding protein